MVIASVVGCEKMGLGNKKIPGVFRLYLWL